MKYLQFLIALIFVLAPMVSYANVHLPQNRSLIAVVNLVDHASSRKWLYRIEDAYAAKLIKLKTKRNYKKVIILKRSEATFQNFLTGLKTLVEENPDEPVDVIFYIHGLGNGQAVPALCFVGQSCIPVKDVSDQIKSTVSNAKLGFLYSDACWGSKHMVDLLASGFMVVTGSSRVDANNTSDLKRFLKAWNKGRSFQESIDFANKNPMSKIKDFLVKNAGSFKRVMGDGNLRWDGK